MLRPNWHQYFMMIAWVARERSPDINTKHACILVDSDNRILSIGYNGFLRGVDDSAFPNSRGIEIDGVNKYDAVIHAEANAIYNCKIRPENASAYVTGTPCNECLKALWQFGVKKIFALNRQGTVLEDEKTERVRKKILRETNMQYATVDFPYELFSRSHASAMDIF